MNDEPRDQSSPPGGDETALTLYPEVIPNLDELVIEDGKPVESIFAEKQQRLLTEPLYASWPGPGEGRTFLALANVGLFYASKQPPLVPDAMLSLDVRLGDDLSRRENRSYFTWLLGKVPDVVVEIVSDRRGGEATHKLRDYARIGVPYYVIFDPEEHLEEGVVRAFGLVRRTYEPVALNWMADVGLGLTLWQGTYAGMEAQWLRWCDQRGQVIPTGQERAEQERQRAEQEHQRVEQERQRRERLEAQLRALGIDPSV
jgi:Uma2 family endonuclease